MSSISLSTAVIPARSPPPEGLSTAPPTMGRCRGDARCCRSSAPARAGMEIGRSRGCLLQARLDVGGGGLGLRRDLDQVVDATHPSELADCALGGVSLRCRFDLSMEHDVPVTDLRRDRVWDLCTPASQMRDLLGDL